LHAKTRSALAASALAGLSACAGPGINAGEQGGLAFIALTVMLVLACFVLWLVLGRGGD
jgi:hypothetical protein